MPLFGYRCLRCDAQSELLVRADEEVCCPVCGSSKMERQMSRVAPVVSSKPEPACAGCSMGNDGCCDARQQTCCMS